MLKRVPLYLSIGLFMACPLFAQWRPAFEVGIRAGRPQSPLLQIVNTQYAGLANLVDYTHNPNYAVGPTFAFSPTDHISIQFDALYKPLRYETTFGSGNEFGGTLTKAGWWEFPLTGKWRFSHEGFRPFAGGGISFNRVHGTTNEYVYNAINPANPTVTRFSNPYHLTDSPFGWVATGGVELPIGPLRVVPELRYTHWSTSIFQPGDYAWPDQYDILIGVTFRK